MRERPTAFHFSVVSLVEIEQGIAKLRRVGDDRKADALAAWLERMVSRFRRNIIPIDSDLAFAIGRLVDAAIAIGRHPGLADLAIAATAQTREMRLLTRNLRHFVPLSIDAADPFEGQS